MCIAMLASYFLGQRLHNPGHGPKIKVVAEKMEVFQNALAGHAYNDMTRSVDQIDKVRCWAFNRRK